jgi:hypothetical protein
MSSDDVVFVATCGYCGHSLGESRADVLDFSFLASRGVERPAVLGKVHVHCALESLPQSIRQQFERVFATELAAQQSPRNRPDRDSL